MNEQDNPLKNAELSTEQNYNCIDGILNNAPITLPPAAPIPEEKSVGRVKDQTERKRSRELER